MGLLKLHKPEASCPVQSLAGVTSHHTAGKDISWKWYRDCEQGQAEHVVHGVGIPPLLHHQLPLHDYHARPKVSCLAGKDRTHTQPLGAMQPQGSKVPGLLSQVGGEVCHGQQRGCSGKQTGPCSLSSQISACCFDLPKDSSVDGTGVKFWLHTFTAWI